ncbi:alpha/beta hydrolase [Paraburkholderia monticola]|uniref:Alpha/beta hydrolase n=1 Tax=Paraburkholderia monticola TaxID=1399968 RepID=A0A149PKJ8_9BURK|nr:alpha/beta hydrolase [Paraburkholderia monticola]KXU85562.1 alpha/beta hydrolase [Paraburkholderia monticola]
MAIQIVLLPGLLCDEAVWSDQLPALSQFAECYIPDYALRNSIGAMAEHVLASVHAKRLLVAGHSMGGRVALEVFRRAPERIASLALLDTGYQARAAGESGEHERMQRFGLLSLARENGMRAMGEQWSPGMVHPDRLGSDVYRSILEMIERSTPEKFEAQICALLDRPDATGVLDEIRCPTTLVCGREDRWSPLARHEEMHTRIQGSRLHAIEQCGHMSTMERPNHVNEVLVDWARWSISKETANA